MDYGTDQMSKGVSIKQLLGDYKNFLIVVCGVTFVFHAMVFIFLIHQKDNAWIYPDSVQYYDTAVNIVHGNGITAKNGAPQMYRLPGYPLFLAAGLGVRGGNVTVALWLQLLLSCFIPLLMFLLSYTIFPGCSLLAMIVTCWSSVHVGFALYAGMVATETLSLLFLLLFFICFFSGRSFILAGVWLGIASLIRPIGLYTLILSLLLLAAISRFTGHRIKKMGSLIGGWLIVVTPWLLRNFMLTGALFFHTLPGHHFLQYSAAYVVMERDHCSYGDARVRMLKEWDDAIRSEEQTLGRSVNDYQRCSLAERIAWKYLTQHPWYAIKTSSIQVMKTVCGLFTAQTLLSDAGVWPDYTEHTTVWTKMKRFLFPNTQHKILIPLIYWEIFSLFLLLMGVFLFVLGALFDRRLGRVAILLLPFIMLFVGITVAYGCARLRFPAEPLLLMCSGAGWLWIYQWLQTVTNIF